MESLTNNDNSKQEENIILNKNKVNSFDKLCKIQKLLKKESALNELCNL